MLIGTWEEQFPYTVEESKVQAWYDLQLLVPAGFGGAGGRCYLSYHHYLGGTTGFPEHDVAKVAATIGHIDKACHRKKEKDVIAPAHQQELREYATILHNAGHGGPALYRAALKSGAHPSKCGLSVPILSNRLGGGFSSYDRQRSKEVPVSESKAFVSYLLECSKTCRLFKAESLLASKMDLEDLETVIKDVLRAGWLGHSKVNSWKDCKLSFVDEFGHDLTNIRNRGRDEVADALIELKEAARVFSPRNPIFATEGTKSIESAEVEWVTQQQHKGSLRQKMTSNEQEVYAMFLASQKPSLLDLARRVSKLVAGDSGNKDAILDWSTRVAHGTHAATPTPAVPQTTLPSVITFLGQNA
eukprot:6226052-Amphidinium_carterae.1